MVARSSPSERREAPTGSVPTLRSRRDFDRLGQHGRTRSDRLMSVRYAANDLGFDRFAISSAGARGLMQLMPGMAKIVAKQYRMRYSKSKLTSDPKYNVTLGVAHLGDLVADFRGSYVLTLVGYNAGPGRVIDAGGIPDIRETKLYVAAIMGRLSNHSRSTE